MTQRRIQDYGTPISASDLKGLSSSFTGATVFEGYDFVVDGVSGSQTRIRVNPGKAVTNEGVIIIENEPKYVSVTNTSVSADYTIYYSHIDQNISGGTAAELIIEPGIITNNDISGVVLGYIIYPGSAIPVDASHFIQPVHTQLNMFQPTNASADWVIPINNTGYHVISNSNVSIVNDFTSNIMSAKFQNVTLSVGTLSIVFPFKVKESKFFKLQTRISATINAVVTPTLLDSDGSPFSLGVAIQNVPTITLFERNISSNAVQTPNTLVYVKLDMTIQPSRSVNLQAIGLSNYSLPY